MLGNRPTRIALVAASAIAMLVVSTGAAAAAPTAASGRPCAIHVVENVRKAHTYNHFGRGSDWKVGGDGPGKLILSRTVTASNSFSGTFGASVPELSASLGFDVTASVGFTAGFEFDIPAEPRGAQWTLEAGTRDDVYNYDVQTYSCLGEPVGNPKPGTAERTGHLVYRHYIESAP